MTNYKKDICNECGGIFELIPPADTEFCIPKENKSEEDYIMRRYECDNLAHQKEIYWIKKDISHVGGPIPLTRTLADSQDYKMGNY